MVLYGHSGAESLSLAADQKSVKTLLSAAKVNNSQVRVNVKDQNLSFNTLLKEVDTNPVNHSDVYQVVFFAIDANKQLAVVVPLVFTGEAIGVKLEDGVLDTVMTDLDVHCVSGDIPDHIAVDVSEMKVGDILHIGDLVLPEGISLDGAPERVVVSVLSPTLPELEPAEEGEAETETAEKE